MDTQLLTLSKIFTERLFRIPDYQRGYAWTEKQLKDFWNDIQQLEQGRNHYTGVLTLESVPAEKYRNWEDDVWIVDAKSYQPYFVVDGQQRLTTAIILIQVLLERLPKNSQLNFTSRDDIQRKFIFDSKNDGISRSYVFGYERDNPSYEFLKTRIFCEKSTCSAVQETVYAHNLIAAKCFFADRVAPLTGPQTEALYKKITQNLLFNIFTITEDVDVCVAFETMNNRGKPLSYLELLKNRLIYLSLRFSVAETETSKLRRAINDCWKTIYHNLGRDKDRPLDDDRFLSTHYITYFGKAGAGPIGEVDYEQFRRLGRADYAADLLERRFVPKNLSADVPPRSRITIREVYRYVSSLQEAIDTWFKLHNPMLSDFGDETKIWLDKMNRLGMDPFHPLMLAFFQHVPEESKRVAFLQAAERFLFVTMLMEPRFTYAGPFDNGGVFVDLALRLTANAISPESITRRLAAETDRVARRLPHDHPTMLHRLRVEGFYRWRNIRYFLYEYNLDLQARSKTERAKIFWPEFSEDRSDFITVEHIYPQKARHRYWATRFGSLTARQRDLLRDSLGNLLPLSKPKNSSLSNRPFPEKVGNGSQPVGYRYGSYAENEVAKEANWTPNQIKARGLAMLDFMERRWRLKLGSRAFKNRLLNVEGIRG
jgi:hypothetical protein